MKVSKWAKFSENQLRHEVRVKVSSGAFHLMINACDAAESTGTYYVSASAINHNGMIIGAFYFSNEQDALLFRLAWDTGV